MLTTGQKQQFDTFGFVVLRQLFTPKEVEILRHASEEILSLGRGGEPFDGHARQSVVPFFERSPELMRLIEDDRIYSIGEDLLGPDFFLEGTEGNLHVGDSQWHTGIDGPDPKKPHNIKITFYLEPLTAETGALRVIPGSHQPDFRKPMEPLWAQYNDTTVMPFGVAGQDVPAFVIESKPGDVVVFPEKLWHGSFGGASGRSQHAISFHTNVVTDKHVAWLLDMYSRTKYSWRPCESMINSDRPRLRRLVARLMELGFDSTPI